jgi:hypothetical protein
MGRHYSDVAETLFRLLSLARELLDHAKTLQAEEDPENRGEWDDAVEALRGFDLEKEGVAVIRSQAESYLVLAEEFEKQNEDPQTRERMFTDFPKSLIDFIGDEDAILGWFEKIKDIPATAIQAAYGARNAEGGTNGFLILGAVLVLVLVFYTP